MRLRVLVLAAGLLWPVCAFSQNADTVAVSGNELYSRCIHGPSTPQYVACLAYVEGTVDALSVDKTICLPESHVTTGQVKDIIVNYLRDHPQNRHNSASLLAAIALNEAFPCKK